MARISGGSWQVLAAVVVAGAFYLTAPDNDRQWRWTASAVQVSRTDTIGATAPIFEERIVDHRPGDKRVSSFQHAASFVRIGGELVAFWYSGIYEGAADTQIRSARFDGKVWSPATVVTDQMGTARDLGRFVKTVGNAVPYLAGDGTLHLFYTIVPMRGWSTASLAVKSSRDGGRTWSRARRLITSPLLNLSTMVKSAPLTASDGSILLPCYWSLGTQYPVLVRVGRDLRVTGLYRMGDNVAGLQPAIVPADDRRAMAFLRALRHTHEFGLRTTTTMDAGRTWSAPMPTDLPNEGWPTAPLRLGPDRILAVVNEEKETVLSLVEFGDDGRLKRRLFPLPTRFSGNKAYPYMLGGGEGGIVDLMFSCEDNTAICHVRFNEAWLTREQQRVTGEAR